MAPDRSPPVFVYVTYICQPPPKRCGTPSPIPTSRVSTGGTANVSDWQAGSCWEHQRTDGSGIADVVGTRARSRNRQPSWP